MMSHGLTLITVDDRGAGAKWACACGACGFCYPDAWTPDEGQRAAELYAATQAAHRRHVARAITEGFVGCGFVGRPRNFCHGGEA